MNHLSHMMGLPVEAADALTDLWAWLAARVRCKQKNQKCPVWNGCLCVWHDGPFCRHWAGSSAVASWCPDAMYCFCIVKIKRRWIELIQRFTANPGRASLLKLFVLLSLTTVAPAICWSLWVTSTKGNAVICTPGARMGAFKHLVCMQRRLMHPAPWLLWKPLQILECEPECSLNKLCAYAIKTKLCCFLST